LSIDRIIGLVLLAFGVPGILLSIFYESTVVAFIGLTLTFWGCLFLLVLPGKYVKTEVMDYMSSSTLSAINQIIASSNLKGKPVYIPVPRGLYLPYQIGTKNEFVYIPRKEEETQTALEQVFTKKPNGLRLTPPGLALADLAEKKSKVNFSNLDLDSLPKVLPPIITQELEIAENVTITIAENSVHTEVKKAACQDLCSLASKMQHICPHIGCPITSSIACILTRVTNRPIILERCLLTNNTIEAHYEIVQ